MNDETKHPTKVRCNFNTYFVSGDTREHECPLTPGRVYDVLPESVSHPRHFKIKNDNGQELLYDRDMFSVVETA